MTEPAPLTSPSPSDRGPEVAQMKERFLSSIRGAREGDGWENVIAYAIILGLSATIVLLPLALKLWRNFRATRDAKARLNDVEAFARRAEPVMGYPLMVNSGLRHPGNSPAPGLVIISFDRRGDSIDYMAGVVAQVEKGTRGELSSSDSAFCLALMDDEEYVPFRRRRLPEAITGGAAVYACDLAIHPHLLHGRHISDEMPLIGCIAEPGDEGMILQMPYWHITATPAPDEAAKQSFYMTLLSVPELKQLAAKRVARRGGT